MTPVGCAHGPPENVGRETRDGFGPGLGLDGWCIIDSRGKRRAEGMEDSSYHFLFRNGTRRDSPTLFGWSEIFENPGLLRPPLFLFTGVWRRKRAETQYLVCSQGIVQVVSLVLIGLINKELGEGGCPCTGFGKAGETHLVQKDQDKEVCRIWMEQSMDRMMLSRHKGSGVRVESRVFLVFLSQAKGWRRDGDVFLSS